MPGTRTSRSRTSSSPRCVSAASSRRPSTIQRATAAAHNAYRTREKTTIPPDPATAQLTPGRLAMIIRPSHNKLLTTNAGPFLILRVQPPIVDLQSLTHSVTLRENVKNVRLLQLALP